MLQESEKGEIVSTLKNGVYSIIAEIFNQRGLVELFDKNCVLKWSCDESSYGEVKISVNEAY